MSEISDDELAVRRELKELGWLVSWHAESGTFEASNADGVRLSVGKAGSLREIRDFLTGAGYRVWGARP